MASPVCDRARQDARDPHVDNHDRGSREKQRNNHVKICREKRESFSETGVAGGARAQTSRARATSVGFADSDGPTRSASVSDSMRTRYDQNTWPNTLRRRQAGLVRAVLAPLIGAARQAGQRRDRSVDQPHQLAQRHLARVLDQDVAAMPPPDRGDEARVAHLEQDMFEKPLWRAGPGRDLFDPQRLPLPARSAASSISAFRAYFIFCVIMALNTRALRAAQLNSRQAVSCIYWVAED
jgi:hypothetical protein